MLHIAVDVIGVTALFFIVKMLAPDFYTMGSVSYLEWLILATKVGFTALAVFTVTNCVFYFPKLKSAFLSLIKKK